MTKTDAIRTVGITGAGGNVGTTLSKAFGDDFELKLFDIGPIAGAGAPQVQADLSDEAQTRGLFEGVDALLHIAGNPRPDAPIEETRRHNFVAFSNVMEEAHRAGVKKLLFASSNFYHETAITAAMRNRTRLIQLSDPPTPRCMYAVSKVYGEHLGFHYSLQGMQFGAMRIGWTVPGDNPRPYWGEYMRAMYCSHRDLGAAFKHALSLDRPFFSAFVISNNERKVFDLRETAELLGYMPVDNAENFA
jgi:NAD+ dependent glucose-6-phosphate dehydrogenase